jgi:hypothetical protein
MIELLASIAEDGVLPNIQATLKLSKKIQGTSDNGDKDYT